jgi:transketolase
MPTSSKRPFPIKLPYRVWVLLGDSEMAEGSIWEAFDKA